MTATNSKPGLRASQRARLTRTAFQERVDEPYGLKGKRSEPTVCRTCGAVYHKGRWQWLPRPGEANEQLCPACHRIHDRVAAGYVRLRGAFLTRHRDEVMRLARNHADKARREHPLQRVIAFKDDDGGVLITTTDIHLARGIAEAVKHAYQGRLNVRYNKDQNLLRVNWQRDAF